jgi:hypothetical protein
MQGLGQSGWHFGFDQDSALGINQAGNSSDIGSYDGPSASKGFENHVRRSLRLTRQAENIAGGEPLRNFGRTLGANKSDDFGEPLAPDALCEFGQARTIPDTDDLQAGVSDCEDASGAQKVPEALDGDQAADEDD